MDGINFPTDLLNCQARILTHSADETRALGFHLGKLLPKDSVVCFFGDLGAGKTTLIKGLVEAAAGIPAEQVNSPTFTYLNIYPGPKPVYHFDLYRLAGAEDFLHMGFDEYFTAGGICCLEWSERIPQLLPKTALRVTIQSISIEKRQIDLLSGSFE